VKVFISWSGERSRLLAEALREWLPLVLHYVEPWLSHADIEAGERWAQTVAKELAESNFGIICVTSENIGSPWILFEAGAITKSLETSRVIPLLLDLEFSDVSGPLAQFQSKKLLRQGIEEVVQSIQGVAEQQIPEQRATELFNHLWRSLEEKFEAIPKEAPAERENRPTTEVLEELVASVRSLDGRIRDCEDPPRSRRRGKRSRMGMHPMMLREFGDVIGEKSNDPVQLLFVSSLFRDELPWLHELATDAYRALREKRPDSRFALERFRRCLEMLMRGPFHPEEFDVDPELIMMAIHALERFGPELDAGEEEGGESLAGQ